MKRTMIAVCGHCDRLHILVEMLVNEGLIYWCSVAKKFYPQKGGDHVSGIQQSYLRPS